MKPNKTKTIEIPATIKKVAKDGYIYYNVTINIEGMDLCIAPKFLNFKQRILLRHKLARLMGDEKNVK